MSTFRNPVGPQAPSVYWRRRLMVLLGLIAVIVVIALIVARPGAASEGTPSGSSSESADAPSTNGTADADADAADAPAVPGACNPAVISLEAITDKTTYAAGETPLISMKVTNMGSAECDLAVGTDIQAFVISSGSDQYWSSVDCQSAPVAQQVSIKPGAAGAMSTTPIPWDRTRSDPATCNGDRPDAPAGGASYHLTVKLGDLKSQTRQFLLY